MPDKITKFINSLDNKSRLRVIKILEILRKDRLTMPGIRKLQGYHGLFRIRVGKIRIVFKMPEKGSIEVVDIGYRGNIY